VLTRVGQLLRVHVVVKNSRRDNRTRLSFVPSAGAPPLLVAALAVVTTHLRPVHFFLWESLRALIVSVLPAFALACGTSKCLPFRAFRPCFCSMTSFFLFLAVLLLPLPWLPQPSPCLRTSLRLWRDGVGQRASLYMLSFLTKGV
jgi:hypothetical protein